MSSIYDMDDVLSAEEMEAVKQNTRQRLSLWRRQGVYRLSSESPSFRAGM
jgi:hypothetical protein